MEKLVLNCIVNPILFLVLALNFYMGDTSFDFFEALICIFIPFFSIVSFNKKERYSLEFFFVTLLFLFQGALVPLSIIFNLDLNYANLMRGFYFNNYIIYKSLLIYLSVFIIINIVFTISNNGKKTITKLFQKSKVPFSINGSILILTTIILILTIRLNHLINYGYLNYFTNEIELPFSGLYQIILISIEVVLISKLLKREYNPKRLNWLFILLSISTIADGRRALAMLNLILLLIINIKFYSFKLKKNYIVIFSLASLIILTSISQFRASRKVDRLDLNYIATSFVAGQSDSFYLIPTSLEALPTTDYNLYDTTAKFRRNITNYFKTITLQKTDDNPKDAATKNKIYSLYISNKMDPIGFSYGLGMGGNFIAELISLTKSNFFLILILSSVIALFITLISKGFTPGSSNLLIKFYIVRGMLYIPRNNLLDFLSDLILPIAVYILIIVFLSVKNKLSFNGT